MSDYITFKRPNGLNPTCRENKQNRKIEGHCNPINLQFTQEGKLVKSWGKGACGAYD